MPQITVPLTDKENLVLHTLAAEKDLSPEKILILALRSYQLQSARVNGILDALDQSPGCGGED